MRPNPVVRLLAAFTLLGAVPLAAQQTREALIEQARSEFDEAARLDLLTRAADPGLGAPDSLWAIGVFDLAQNLIGSGQAAQGALWLRWEARHGGRWTIDRAYYSPSTVAAYDQAVPAVQTEGGRDSPDVSTRWRWPEGFDASASGSLEVATAEPSVPLTVSVEGRGTVEPGGTLALAPATYQITAEAPGYETLRVTREILPGATTVLEFDLAPELSPDTRGQVAPALVSIRYLQGGQQVCANGLMARPGGLVLTAGSALGQNTGLSVVTPTGTYRDVSVTATDAGLDLAVLRVNASEQPTLPSASGVTDEAHAWSLYRVGCGEATSAHTRLTGWRAPPAGPVGLSPALPAGAAGSPLFDRTGALIGLVTGGERVAPISLARDLLARAAQDVVAAQAGGGGGGLPWVWIGAGAAAVGVAAAVLGGGGGGGGGGTPAPTTGSITVTFPGGGL
jgi:hypothetical protein